jgi:hypothetical protein
MGEVADLVAPLERELLVDVALGEAAHALGDLAHRRGHGAAEGEGDEHAHEHGRHERDGHGEPRTREGLRAGGDLRPAPLLGGVGEAGERARRAVVLLLRFAAEERERRGGAPGPPGRDHALARLAVGRPRRAELREGGRVAAGAERGGEPRAGLRDRVAVGLHLRLVAVAVGRRAGEGDHRLGAAVVGDRLARRQRLAHARQPVRAQVARGRVHPRRPAQRGQAEGGGDADHHGEDEGELAREPEVAEPGHGGAVGRGAGGTLG